MLNINTSVSASRTGDCGTNGRNEKAERAGKAGNMRASVGQVGVIVGCEYMLGLTK